MHIYSDAIVLIVNNTNILYYVYLFRLIYLLIFSYTRITIIPSRPLLISVSKLQNHIL